jgi:two-component system chemotaxis response regulator CheY
MKILLVDDSSSMRRIQKTQLGNLGITNIIEAEDGEDALEKLAENMPVDLVCLDINMPKMDGMTCLKRIRDNAEYKDVKIVMVTSESEKKKVIEAIQAGANNYLVKPFTPESLKEKLQL